MPLQRRLETVVFEPEVVAILQDVYAQVCAELGLRLRPDPLNEIVAEKIVVLVRQGTRDMAALREAALKALSR
jgi:hypothetical protein